MLFAEPANAGVWASLETVRAAVGRHRGAGGKQNRARIKNRFSPSPLSCSTVAIESSPFYIPPTDCTEWKPYVIKPARTDTTAILCDVHIPYHDPVALGIAGRAMKERGVDRIILNGDILDFYQLSDFERDPRRRAVASYRIKADGGTVFVPGELELAKRWLEGLREEWPEAEIILKIGNHEERYERYLGKKAPDLIGLPELALASLLDLYNLGIKYVADKRPIFLGRNIFIHGHEFGRGFFSPVSAARGLFLRAKTSAVQGDAHRTSEHPERTLDGSEIICWSIGCLCGLHPDYRPINNWNQGFAFQTTHVDGTFEFENRRILKSGRTV
jgi:hypothetical protein